MVSQASRHSRSLWLPLGANQLSPRRFPCGQRQPQALVWTREVVERLKEDHVTSQLRTVFTKAPTLPCQWRQGMTEGQVEPLSQTGADLQSQGASRAVPQQMRSLRTCKRPRFFSLTRCA